MCVWHDRCTMDVEMRRSLELRRSDRQVLPVASARSEAAIDTSGTSWPDVLAHFFFGTVKPMRLSHLVSAVAFYGATNQEPKTT